MYFTTALLFFWPAESNHIRFYRSWYDNPTIKAKEEAEAFVVLLQNNKITEDALQYL